MYFDLHIFYFLQFFVSVLIMFVLYYFLICSNSDAEQYLSFPSMRSSMHRERVKSRPSVPKTLASLRDMLDNSNILKDIYQESVTLSDDNVAIILSNSDLLEGLSSATEIYVDGTFSVSLTVFY